MSLVCGNSCLKGCIFSVSEEEKKVRHPHVAMLALAEAGGLAKVLPKDCLPSSSAGQERREDR